MSHFALTSLCIAFWCTLLNPPSREVFRGDLSSSAKKGRLEIRWVLAVPWLRSEASLWCLAPLHWLFWVSVCCPTALGSLWGFLNAMVKPGTVPYDPGWLWPSWFPSGSCWCLTMIWGPWAVTPCVSGERSRWSSCDCQRPETEEHGWWYSWEGWSCWAVASAALELGWCNMRWNCHVVLQTSKGQIVQRHSENWTHPWVKGGLQVSMNF